MAIRNARERPPAPKLRRPRYLTYTPQGKIDEMFCKLCGDKIAEQTRDRGFVYLKNYAELKMDFDDGSKHVTNCCDTCLYIISASTELMDSCHKADVDVMVAEDRRMGDLNLKLRKVRKFLVADTRGAGLP